MGATPGIVVPMVRLRPPIAIAFMIAFAGLTVSAPSPAAAVEEDTGGAGLIDESAPPVEPSAIAGEWTVLRITETMEPPYPSWQVGATVMRRWRLEPNCDDGACDVMFSGAGVDGSYFPDDVVLADDPESMITSSPLVWAPEGDVPAWTFTETLAPYSCTDVDGVTLDGAYVGGDVWFQVELHTDALGRDLMLGARTDTWVLTPEGVAAGCDPAIEGKETSALVGVREDQMATPAPTVWSGEWVRSSLVVSSPNDAPGDEMTALPSEFPPTTFTGGCADVVNCVVEEVTTFSVGGDPTVLTYGGAPDIGLVAVGTRTAACVVDGSDPATEVIDPFGYNATSVTDLQPFLVDAAGEVQLAIARRSETAVRSPTSTAGPDDCQDIPQSFETYELYLRTGG